MAQEHQDHAPLPCEICSVMFKWVRAVLVALNDLEPMRMHWCSEQVHTRSVSQGKIRVLKTVQIMGWCADTSASRIHASFVLNLLGAPLPQFFIILQGIAGATGVSNFLRAFLMVSLNSVSSGSMK